MSIKLNLGGGKTWHEEGWVNLDRGLDGYDLSDRLLTPFGNGSVDLIFTAHCLEHLTFENAALLLVDCHRVLVPGGVFRLVLPDMNDVANIYLTEEKREKVKIWFGWDYYMGHPSTINKVHDHRSHYTHTTLRIALWLSGFGNDHIIVSSPLQSMEPEMRKPIVLADVDGYIKAQSGFDNMGGGQIYMEAQKDA